MKTLLDIYEAAYDAAQSDYYSDTLEYIQNYSFNVFDIALSDENAQMILNARLDWQSETEKNATSRFFIVEHDLRKIEITRKYTVILAQDAHPSDTAGYWHARARLITDDPHDPTCCKVTWQERPDYDTTDNGEACDWDNPVSITHDSLGDITDISEWRHYR